MTDEEGAPRWFVLWAEDQELHYPCLEERFLAPDLSALREIIGEEADDDPNLKNGYWLDGQQLTRLAAAFGVGAEFATLDFVCLDSWSALRDAPYLVHTRFELFLMLEGRKKLAVFGDAPDWLDDCLAPFDRFVAEGRLIKRVVDEPLSAKLQAIAVRPLTHIRQVLFALPGQEWRIDAYLLMGEICKNSGWNETLERLEGHLYGYEDWQVEWWVAERRRRMEEHRRATANSMG